MNSLLLAMLVITQVKTFDLPVVFKGTMANGLEVATTTTITMRVAEGRPDVVIDAGTLTPEPAPGTIALCWATVSNKGNAKAIACKLQLPHTPGSHIRTISINGVDPLNERGRLDGIPYAEISLPELNPGDSLKVEWSWVVK